MTQSQEHPDLAPAVEHLVQVLRNVADEQLGLPTPCEDLSAAALLDHLMMLSLAFRVGAEKGQGPEVAGPPPEPSADALDPAWRALLPQRLDALAAAWRSPAAWTGEAAVGGLTMPGEVMGLVALDEITLHGWDLARATSQSFSPAAETVTAVLPFLEQTATDEGTPGLFGPRVHVPPGATPFDRALGLSGRDPSWRP